MVSVAATDRNDARASFSNANADVEIAAAGVDVLSTKRGGGYVAFSGTSMATPHVAGVAAIIAARNPSFSGAQIRAKLQTSVDDLGAPGRDPQFGFGRVNLAKAAPKGWPERAWRRSGGAQMKGPGPVTDAHARPPGRSGGLHAAVRPGPGLGARAGGRRGRADHEPLLLRRRAAGARRRRARGLLPLGAARADGATRGSPSTCRTCCATGALAREADVVHFQWLSVQALDTRLLPAKRRGC